MVINDPQLIDRAWVEAALRNAGALDIGGVAEIELEPTRERAWSLMTRIAVRYNEGSSGHLPERLLLKICATAGGDFGPSEVRYYTRDYVGLIDAPIPRCFDAAYQESPRRYHLLLEDLSATHTNFDGHEPTVEHVHAFAESLATLHAYRWGAERLGTIGLEMPGREDFSRYMAHVGKGLEPLLALSDGELDAAWSRRLPVIFDRLVECYAQRARNPHGITKIHGDLNPGNILVPITGASPIYLIDHQPFDWSLTRWLGVSDLVYAMVLYWESPTRRRLEMLMLRCYHAALLARNVVDYTFDQLLEDYRLCIAEAVAAAVEWCVLHEDRERMRWLWSVQLHRALAAYEDLRCGEIWE